MALAVQKGASCGQVARHYGVSVPTVKRHWKFARAWLLQEIEQIVKEP